MAMVVIKHRKKLILLSKIGSYGRRQLLFTKCHNKSGADNSQGIIVIGGEILRDQIATLMQKWLGEEKKGMF
jgi:hypothetical protein